MQAFFSMPTDWLRWTWTLSCARSWKQISKNGPRFVEKIGRHLIELGYDKAVFIGTSFKGQV